jgi:hypothetical protein
MSAYAIGETSRVPSVPELFAQVRALDAQIQQTDREIAARRFPAHPQGPKEAAEWDELQAWFVNKHWRPFVALWEHDVKEVREYEAGTRSSGRRPLIELLTWITRMGEEYNFLWRSAAASFYIDVSTPHVTNTAMKASGDEGERDMRAYAGRDSVGADGQSYPEVAAEAVRSIHAQHRSPYYGYIRSGINQKIYLFPRLEDARAWFSQHVQLQPDHDYAAVFSASNLRAPVAGMEHFMRTAVGCDPHIGSWWPFFLGLPLGGLGGYFLRRWQEQNPGQALPLVPPGTLPAPKIPPEAMSPAPTTAGNPYVGGPWLDLVGQDYGYTDDSSDNYADAYSDVYADDYSDDDDDDDSSVVYDFYSIGCPSYSLGAEVDDAARRRSWPQTMALIQSAIDEVKGYAATYPTEAYVWILHAPTRAPYAGRASSSVVMLEGTTEVVPFSSQNLALDYLRQAAQTHPVALAMFERSSPHWPNPVAWRKSDQPEHEQVIAQHVASRSTTSTSGAYMGADTVIGAAIDDVRRRAQTLAERRAGNVIGVIHTSKDGLWHTLAFRTSDDADDWLGTATQEPAAYTYAAYYDKEDFQWPHPVNEKIGGARTPTRPDLLGSREIATTSGGRWT